MNGEKMESQRLKLIKILLNYMIEKNRQEENFMELINENKDLFNIDISPMVFPQINEIAEELGIEDEEEVEDIFESFNSENLDIGNVVEEFCKKYNI